MQKGGGVSAYPGSMNRELGVSPAPQSLRACLFLSASLARLEDKGSRPSQATAGILQHSQLLSVRVRQQPRSPSPQGRGWRRRCSSRRHWAGRPAPAGLCQGACAVRERGEGAAGCGCGCVQAVPEAAPAQWRGGAGRIEAAAAAAAAEEKEEEEGERREVFLSVPAVCSGSGSAAAGAARRELRIARPPPTPPARARLPRPPWPGTTTTSSSCSSSATAVRAAAAGGGVGPAGRGPRGPRGGQTDGEVPARAGQAGLSEGRRPQGRAEGLRLLSRRGWGTRLRSGGPGAWRSGLGRRVHSPRLPLPHV